MTNADQPRQSGILGLLGEIKPEERAPAFLMLLNLMIILISYYVIKVVREPLILSTPGGAQWKSYGAAAQALALMGYVPLYSWFTSRVNRVKLILGVNIFFLICIELFTLAILSKVPYIGVLFFVWVGIFSLSLIAQFWSLANDICSEEQGKRLFPIIAIGATLGSPLGSQLASILFDAELSIPLILQASAVLLLVSMLFYWYLQTRRTVAGESKADSGKALQKADGFALVMRSRYLLLLSALFLLLNVVNTTGEYILSYKVVEAAASSPAQAKDAFIGSFYGNYFFVVNLAALILQTLVVSRIVKYLGIAGVVLMLPIISLGAYSVIAAGAGMMMIRWMKTAENSTDYSVMNTARAMLWLPTSREEKYNAKQAVDTFIVRIGDLLSAGVVFSGIHWLQLSIQGFAGVNIGFAGLWILVALVLLHEYRKLSKKHQAAVEAA